MNKQELDELCTKATPLLGKNVLVATWGDITNAKAYNFVDVCSIGMSDSCGEMRYDAYGTLVSIEDDSDTNIFSLWVILHAIDENLPIRMLSK